MSGPRRSQSLGAPAGATCQGRGGEVPDMPGRIRPRRVAVRWWWTTRIVTSSPPCDGQLGLPVACPFGGGLPRIVFFVSLLLRGDRPVPDRSLDPRVCLDRRVLHAGGVVYLRGLARMRARAPAPRAGLHGVDYRHGFFARFTGAVLSPPHSQTPPPGWVGRGVRLLPQYLRAAGTEHPVVWTG